MASAMTEDPGKLLTEQALAAAGVTDAKKTCEALEYMLKKFRSLECSACHEHFGYSQRSNPSVKFCSAMCLQRGQTGSSSLDQENEAIIEKSLGDIKDKIARVPLTPAKNNLDGMANGFQKDLKSVEPIVRVETALKPKDDIGGSNTSVASGRSGSGAAGSGKDVTDLSSSAGSQSNGAALKKPVERKPFAAARMPLGLPQQTAISAVAVSPPQKTSASTTVPKPTEPPKPAEVKRPVEEPTNAAKDLPAPVMMRPKAVPAAAAPPQPKRLMMNDVQISNNLYNNQQVVIQFIYAPNKFTVSALADEAKIDEVQGEIAKYRKTNPPVKSDLIKDEVVFARYVAEDGSDDYYRAVVTGLVGNNKYKVTFVDYGDSREVTAADCLEPSKDIMEKYPFFGVVFTLKNTVGQELSMAELESTGYGVILEGGVFTVEIDSSNGINWTGDLYCSDSKTALTKHLKEANDTVKPKTAPAPPKASEPKPASTSSAEPVQQAAKPQPAPSKPSEPQPRLASSSAAAAEDSAPKRSPQSRYSVIKTNPFLKPEEVTTKPGKRNPGYSPNIMNGAKVQIAFIWTNNKVTLNAETDLPKIDELGGLVAQCIKPDNKVKELPEVGNIVIAPYENSYYRGRVDSIEGDLIMVTFIDYGAAAKVKYSDCYEVDENVMKHPFYGRICKLKLIPDDTADVTSPELDQAILEYMTLETNKTEQPIWEVTLKLDETRTYNKLVLKAISISE